MFSLLSVVNGAVVDKPTSGFTGSSVDVTTRGEQPEFIFLLIIVFLAGMFTHYAYVKIKKYIAEYEEDDDDDDNEDDDNEDDDNSENNDNEKSTNSKEYKNNRKSKRK